MKEKKPSAMLVFYNVPANENRKKTLNMNTRII